MARGELGPGPDVRGVLPPPKAEVARHIESARILGEGGSADVVKYDAEMAKLVKEIGKEREVLLEQLHDDIDAYYASRDGDESSGGDSGPIIIDTKFVDDVEDGDSGGSSVDNVGYSGGSGSGDGDVHGSRKGDVLFTRDSGEGSVEDGEDNVEYGGEINEPIIIEEGEDGGESSVETGEGGEDDFENVHWGDDDPDDGGDGGSGGSFGKSSGSGGGFGSKIGGAFGSMFDAMPSPLEWMMESVRQVWEFVAVKLPNMTMDLIDKIDKKLFTNGLFDPILNKFFDRSDREKKDIADSVKSDAYGTGDFKDGGSSGKPAKKRGGKKKNKR